MPTKRETVKRVELLNQARIKLSDNAKHASLLQKSKKSFIVPAPEATESNLMSVTVMLCLQKNLFDEI